MNEETKERMQLLAEIIYQKEINKLCMQIISNIGGNYANNKN